MKIDRKQFFAEAKDAGMFAVGMIAGAQVNRLLKTSVGGVGTLQGVPKDAIAPALTTAAGLAVGATMKQKPLRMVGFGMASMGGVQMLNSLGVNVLGAGAQKASTPIAKTPQAAVTDGGAKAAAGLGYTLEDLPEPPVSGLGGGVFINDNGVVCDENGNPINSLDEGTPMGGFTEGEGEQGGDGALPGIGDVQSAEGVGDLNVIYVEHPDAGNGILENGANLPAYSKI